jgi:hypothetical protein
MARALRMFLGPDGKLMSVRWKIDKSVFRYSRGVDRPIVAPQFPCSTIQSAIGTKIGTGAARG